MKVKELIEKLKEYNDDLVVEIGFSPIEVDKDRKVVAPEPEFQLGTRCDEEGHEQFDYLRIF